MVPPLVETAHALAGRLGFERSCSDEAGRLLHALASQRGRMRVAEIGTGAGVGAAWILSGLPPDVPFVTVEPDDERAAAAAELLAGDGNARVVHGGYELLAAEAPFDLLFVDARPAKHDPGLAGLLAPGGTLVLDDLTPGRPIAGDPLRELWLRHPRLAAVELQLSAREAAIVGVLEAR